MVRALVLLAVLLAGCATERPSTIVPPTVMVPAGAFIRGSDRAEREAAYKLDERAYGHSITRNGRWYESEFKRGRIDLPAFRITRNVITNRQYAAFVSATGYPAPGVSRKVWNGYGLNHPFSRTRRHGWTGNQPPAGREDHPVVLVSHGNARAFANWLGSVTDTVWRLPSEAEWEKAVRGVDGRRFPWGDDFDATRLNGADNGPFDTVPVGGFPNGAGPLGLLDGAGQVYEWTSTSWRPDRGGTARFVVKGGSWDDKGCGVCRPAARHGRPVHMKHILIGFRLIRVDG